MTKHKSRRKTENKDIEQQYCKCCKCPISINNFISEKLNGECNRCFNDNNRENIKRKFKKKQTKRRKSERIFKNF